MSRSSGSRRLAQLRSWLPMAAVLLVMVIVGWSQLRTSSTASTSPSVAPSAAPSVSRSPTTIGSPDLGTPPRPGCEAVEFDTIDVGDLPDEALDTLALIASSGPYPYRQDDGVFSNRERLLPKEPKGYYREYTVVTPGSDDRGARRIIAGECGERWYTDDHYDSFRLIEGAP